MGLCYCEGKGVARDVEKAIYWWEKSAVGGNPSAHEGLAWLYGGGEEVEVEVDMEKAIYW